ncbi:MAG: DUF934 domain-containing protein [Burkholderiaceae bacterium]
MPTLIDTRSRIADTWSRYDGSANGLEPGADCLLPIEEYAERTQVWRGHARRIGIALSATDDPARLAPWLADLALVVVDFAAFTDGRGFSQARLLRSRLDYRGPIRASGTILPDQVPMLHRCGFTEFELASATDAQTALRLLAQPLPSYQRASDGPAVIPMPGNGRLRALSAAPSRGAVRV